MSPYFPSSTHRTRRRPPATMGIPTNHKAILLATFIAFGGFLFGYDIGVISVRVLSVYGVPRAHATSCRDVLSCPTSLGGSERSGLMASQYSQARDSP